MGSSPWGFSHARKRRKAMGYRQVGWLEQCWYIIRYKLRELFCRRR